MASQMPKIPKRRPAGQTVLPFSRLSHPPAAAAPPARPLSPSPPPFPAPAVPPGADDEDDDDNEVAGLAAVPAGHRPSRMLQELRAVTREMALQTWRQLRDGYRARSGTVVGPAVANGKGCLLAAKAANRSVSDLPNSQS